MPDVHGEGIGNEARRAVDAVIRRMEALAPSLEQFFENRPLIEPLGWTLPGGAGRVVEPCASSRRPEHPGLPWRGGGEVQCEGRGAACRERR
jgi:hypothetical protein